MTRGPQGRVTASAQTDSVICHAPWQAQAKAYTDHNGQKCHAKHRGRLPLPAMCSRIVRHSASLEACEIGGGRGAAYMESSGGVGGGEADG